MQQKGVSMSNEEAKGIREAKFFSEFVAISGLPYDLSTVEKRPTPEPDILCVHRSCGPIAFELVELCDPNMAKVFAAPEDAPTYIRTSNPSPRIIGKKLTRQYETPYPIELLIYTNWSIITPMNVIIPTILNCLDAQHPFRQIWLLSKKKVHNLFLT